jgi:hypothetical protein
MSRVFGFVERWFAETEQKPANRGRGKKSQKPEEGRGHFETGLWPTQRGSARSEYGPALYQTRAH